MNFSDTTKNYAPGELKKEHLENDPYNQLLQWLEAAVSAGIEEANAMILATASADGKPSCRTILLKEVNRSGLVFYTNYESRKSQELEENPYAMVTFYWSTQMRQICIEGMVEKISEEESDDYFATRPRGSRVGAWSSRQDRVIDSKKTLIEQFNNFEKKFHDQEIARPPFWGGFRLIPSRYEFWQGGENRLHNRFQYLRDEDSWKIERLCP